MKFISLLKCLFCLCLISLLFSCSGHSLSHNNAEKQIAVTDDKLLLTLLKIEQTSEADIERIKPRYNEIISTLKNKIDNGQLSEPVSILKSIDSSLSARGIEYRNSLEFISFASALDPVNAQVNDVTLALLYLSILDSLKVNADLRLTPSENSFILRIRNDSSDVYWDVLKKTEFYSRSATLFRLENPELLLLREIFLKNYLSQKIDEAKKYLVAPLSDSENTHWQFLYPVTPFVFDSFSNCHDLSGKDYISVISKLDSEYFKGACLVYNKNFKEALSSYKKVKPSSRGYYDNALVDSLIIDLWDRNLSEAQKKMRTLVKSYKKIEYAPRVLRVLDNEIKKLTKPDFFEEDCLKNNSISCLTKGFVEEKFNNKNKAAKFYEKACQLGRKEGCLYLDVLKFEKIKSAKSKYKLVKRCEASEQEACTFLSVIEFGAFNKERGMALALKSCDLGSAFGCSISQQLERACQLDPKEYCYHLGQKLESEDNLEGAKIAFVKSCDAGDGLSCLLLANAEGSKGNLNGQKDYLDRGCKSKHGISCSNLGNYLDKMKQRGKALEAYSFACLYGDSHGCNLFKALNALKTELSIQCETMKTGDCEKLREFN